MAKTHPKVKAISAHMRNWKATGKVAGKRVKTAAGAMKAAGRAVMGGKRK